MAAHSTTAPTVRIAIITASAISVRSVTEAATERTGVADAVRVAGRAVGAVERESGG